MSVYQKHTSRLPQPSGGIQLRSDSTPSSSTPSSRNHSTEDLHVGLSLPETFIVGDRVWVGGTKPGVVAFIGEVHFSSGEWAGVVLDSPVGKNDGSVSGQRYFSCQSNHGIFARPIKLSRSCVENSVASPCLSSSSLLSDSKLMKLPMAKAPEDSSVEAGTQQKAIGAKTSVIPLPRRTSVSSNHSGIGSGLAITPAMTTSLTDASSIVGSDSGTRLRVGDRVTVSGSKCGTVRYIGPTEFANGIWVGIELDDSLGKNDGSVGNKRYFRCSPMYGLFAPLHKVSVVASGNALSRQGSLIRCGDMGCSLSYHRASSQESISSIGSTSSTSRGPAGGRMRLGITSLSGQSTKSRAISGSVAPSLSGFQKALKEKQEHIEQLLKERDLERSEFARTASQIDELESQLSTQRAEHQRFRTESDEVMHRLRARIDNLEHTKTDLQQQLVDEKRKLDDLQFTAEETAIDKADLEVQLEKEMRRIKEFEERVRREDEITEKFRQDLGLLQVARVHGKADDSGLSDNFSNEVDVVAQRTSAVKDKIKSQTGSLCENCCQLIDVDSIFVELRELMDPSNEISSLKLKLQTALSERSVFEIKVNQMHEDLKQILGEKNDAVKEKIDTIGRYEKMAAERDRLIKDRAMIHKQLQEKERQLEEVLREFEQGKKLQTSQMEELQKRTANLQSEAESLLKVQQQLTPYKQQVNSLTERLQSITVERDVLKAEISRLKMTAQSELTESSFKSQIEDIQKRHRQSVKEYELEKLRLHGIIESTKLSIESKDRDIERLKNEVTSVRKDSSADASEANVVDLNNIKHLRQRISQLEKALDESQTNVTNANVNGSREFADENGDKDSIDSQIEFLNSVIVELQRKNVALEARLQIMESSTIMSDSTTESLLNGSISKLLTPRMFCDICDMFDLHETDDCPRQAMLSTSPPASHHHGSRSDQRPYCTACEIFGHSMETCVQDPTF